MNIEITRASRSHSLLERWLRDDLPLPSIDSLPAATALALIS